MRRLSSKENNTDKKETSEVLTMIRISDVFVFLWRSYQITGFYYNVFYGTKSQKTVIFSIFKKLYFLFSHPNDHSFTVFKFFNFYFSYLILCFVSLKIFHLSPFLHINYKLCTNIADIFLKLYIFCRLTFIAKKYIINTTFPNRK